MGELSAELTERAWAEFIRSLRRGASMASFVSLAGRDFISR